MWFHLMNTLVCQIILYGIVNCKHNDKFGQNFPNKTVFINDNKQHSKVFNSEEIIVKYDKKNQKIPNPNIRSSSLVAITKGLAGVVDSTLINALNIYSALFNNKNNIEDNNEDPFTWEPPNLNPLDRETFDTPPVQRAQPAMPMQAMGTPFMPPMMQQMPPPVMQQMMPQQMMSQQMMPQQMMPQQMMPQQMMPQQMMSQQIPQQMMPQQMQMPMQQMPQQMSSQMYPQWQQIPTETPSPKPNLPKTPETSIEPNAPPGSKRIIPPPRPKMRSSSGETFMVQKYSKEAKSYHSRPRSHRQQIPTETPSPRPKLPKTPETSIEPNAPPGSKRIIPPPRPKMRSSSAGSFMEQKYSKETKSYHSRPRSDRHK